jgi:hypothetical protein
VELAQLERHPVPLGERSHGLSDRPTLRRNSVVRVRDHELEPARRRECVQQVEQRHGIPPAGHRDDGRARSLKQPGTGDVAR